MQLATISVSCLFMWLYLSLPCLSQAPLERIWDGGHLQVRTGHSASPTGATDSLPRLHRRMMSFWRTPSESTETSSYRTATSDPDREGEVTSGEVVNLPRRIDHEPIRESSESVNMTHLLSPSPHLPRHVHQTSCTPLLSCMRRNLHLC